MGEMVIKGDALILEIIGEENNNQSYCGRMKWFLADNP